MDKKNRKPEQRKEDMSKTKGPRKILSWAVFIPTITIVLISLTPVVFPALITRTTSPFNSPILEPDVINPFTTGEMSGPFIAINLIILGIGITYYKKRHPKIREYIGRLAAIELTKKQTVIAIIAILVIFFALTVGTISKEETWVDYSRVKERVQSWAPADFMKSFEPHFRYLLLSASLHLGNIRIIPMMISASLLLLVYFFTANITQKKFAGIVSMVILLQSDIFTTYSTTASYDNTWITLYLFSLYLIQRFYRPSPVPYFLSLFSKALTAAFLPMTFYFVARSSLPRRSKIYSLASYGVIVIILAASFEIFKNALPKDMTAFNGALFWQGFSSMAMQMRFDYVIVLFLLPLVVMLFFASRQGTLHSDSMMMIILGILLSAPFLLALTNQTNQPYRFVSLSVFFAVGVGVLFSNRTMRQAEVSSKKS